MARRKESEATVSGKVAGCGRSLLPLGTGPTPGAGADLLSVVESEQQITNDSLCTQMTKLTSQPKRSWMFMWPWQTCYLAEGHHRLRLVDLRGCWLLPATELTRSALNASLGAPVLPTETPS
jgi:hypothetical protein